MRKILLVLIIILLFFSIIGYGQVIYKNKSEVTVASGVSITIPIPTGWSAGDLLIGYVTKDDDYAITPPAGWTVIQNVISNGAMRLWVGYRVAQAGDTEWTWSGDSEAYYGVILLYTGQDPDNPIYNSDNAVGDSATPTAPSVSYTTLEAGSVVFQCFGADRDRIPYSAAPTLIHLFNDYIAGAGGTGGRGGDKTLGPWILPTGHSDPGSKWTEESQAYDNDTDTRATTGCVIPPKSWSGYLELNRASLDITGLRFNAWRQALGVDKVSIDIWYNNDWQNVYEDTYPLRNNKWQVVETVSIATTKMRFNFYNESDSVNMAAHLFEAEFLEEGTVTGSTGTAVFGMDAIDEWAAVTVIIEAAPTQYINLGASRIANASRIDQSNQDNVSVEAGTAWDLNGFKYNNKYIDVTTYGDGPTGVCFSPAGTKMYIMGAADDRVYQYTLSTAWDVSTASYANKFKSVNAQDIYPRGLAFSTGGTKMYMFGLNTKKVFQYTLSTAWDVSTASYADKSLDASAKVTDPKGVCFSDDGTEMYLTTHEPYDTKIFQYSLTTAWDVSTASYTAEYEAGSPAAGAFYGLCFKSDGLKMFVMEYSSNLPTIFQYTLSTAWDITTASYANKKYDLKDIAVENGDLFVKPDGTKIFFCSISGDKAYQLDLAPNWTKTDDFILATRVYTSAGPIARAYKLRWRKTGGTFADVSNTGAITYSATTDLVDGNDLLTGEKSCDYQSGYTWQNGLESEGDNLLPDSGTYSLVDEKYTEHQWALSCDDAEDGATYEFELWDVTGGVSIGTCLATIKMVGVAGFKWNTKTILKWCGKTVSKWNTK